MNAKDIIIGPSLLNKGGIETWAKCLLKLRPSEYYDYKNMITIIYRLFFSNFSQIKFMNLKYLIFYFPILLFSKKGMRIFCYLHGNELFSGLIRLTPLIVKILQVDFISNSNFTKSKFYEITGQESIVSFPLSRKPNLKKNKQYDDRKYDVIIFSRFVRRKRIPETIYALNRSHKKLKIAVAGYGSELERVRSAILESKNDITLEVNPSDEKKYDLLQNSKVFILAPTDMKNAYEGFGIVYLESMYCGTPIISTISGGNEDALNLSEHNSVAKNLDEIPKLLYEYEDFKIDPFQIKKNVNHLFI